MLKKHTVVLVHRLGNDLQKDMNKCAGSECPMVVLGTRHHAVVLCQPAGWKLHPGQQLIDSNRRSAILMGDYTPFVLRFSKSKRLV